MLLLTFPLREGSVVLKIGTEGLHCTPLRMSIEGGGARVSRRLTVNVEGIVCTGMVDAIIVIKV